MIKNYFSQHFRKDITAALIVAMVAVPQAMAYAVIAGVNPVYGLYAAIIPAIVASFFGSSNHVVTGPTNTVALATSGVLVAVMFGENYPEFVFLAAILSGLFKLLLGSFKLGFLIRYVSNSVVTGFLAGAAVLIMVNQLPKILGIRSPAGHNIIDIFVHIFGYLGQINWLVVALGTFSILFLVLTKKFFPRLPSALILVVVTGAIVKGFGWQAAGVRIVGEMGTVGLEGLRFHIPEGVWGRETWGVMLTGSGAIALLSLLEAVSVGKAIALQTGQRINANREFIGQGLASIAGGFFRGIPSSGSLTRSAVNFGGGADTRAASGFSGVLVLIVLAAFQGWIGYIPTVSLGAIVIVSALHMIDFQHIALTWRGRSISKMVIGATFLSVLLLPLQISIYLGVGLSVLFYLVESSHLTLSYLVLNGNGKFAEYKIEDVYEKKPEIAVINVEGPLFFAAVQDLEDQITKMIDVGVHVIVLRLRRMHMMASSGLSTLEILLSRAHERGAEIKLAGVSQEVMKVLHTSGIDEGFEEENIYLATEIPYESTRHAINGD